MLTDELKSRYFYEVVWLQLRSGRITGEQAIDMLKARKKPTTADYLKALKKCLNN